ncbi:MAG: GntR family transcriptional regulator [Ardenticatenaceae bacterium]|nr:GntR family transcriptional regulator [Ardenticatenaceae bacterium]
MATLELNRSPLGDQVYELLRAAILRGEFTPGQRLSPQELSEQLQLSVTPIRDALRRLEADGLVQVSPRRGTFVSQFSAQDVKEVFESRRIIEQAAAAKLPTAPETTIQRMSSLAVTMATLIDGETVRDYPRYLELDEEFHNCIVQILQNRRLTEFYHSLRAYTYVARALIPTRERRMPQTQVEHREILEAFQQRDVARAKQAIALHLDNAAEDILHKMALVSDGSAAGERQASPGGRGAERHR